MLIQYLQLMEERDDEYCKQAITALWKKTGEISSKLGTDMHRDFQFICEGKEPPQGETEEVQMFRKWFVPFLNKYNLEPWRAEWIIYYEHEGQIAVAGQVDLCSSTGNGTSIGVATGSARTPLPSTQADRVKSWGTRPKADLWKRPVRDRLQRCHTMTFRSTQHS